MDPGHDLVRRALDDFLEFATEIDRSIVSLGRETYLGHDLAKLASEALVSKLGEAVNRLPAHYRDAHQEVPWKNIRGLRNIVTHDYGAIDHALIWNAMADRLPVDVEVVRELRRRL